MRILYITFLIFLPSMLFAQQEFAPVGANWYYSIVENIFGDEGYLHMVSERDTIIEGKLSKIISQEYVKSNGDVQKQENLIIYQNGNTIFHLVNDKFRILYDFSAEKGDTIKTYIKNTLDNNEFAISLYVTDISEVNINGTILKQIETAPVAGSNYNYQSAIIESIGSLHGIYPIDIREYDGKNNIGALRCYSDEIIGDYHAVEQYSCYRLISSIKGIITEDNNLLYFNSYDRCIYINTPYISQKKNIKIDVFNTLGQCILSSSINSQKFYLPQNLHGIYVVKVTINSNSIYYEKIYIN